MPSLKEKPLITELRDASQFALVGAVAFGILLGWNRDLPFDPRWIGVCLGLGYYGLTRSRRKS